MQISITGRHLEISEAVKEYTRDKAGKLVRYYDRIERIEVIFDQISNQQRVEMVVRADHRNTFVAQVDAKDS
ncbi:MAG: ribosome-associated translation inhibitor RaiA [Planctomycetota bacterium]|nr:MAG: ribosome-associated translation inhibitor RaiA [Planctomycetota bacterium]